MASTSSIASKKQGKEVLNVQLVRNDVCKPYKFQVVSESVVKGDPTGALSSILLKVLMINDVCSCYMCKIGEIGDYELREAYDKLGNNGVLKDEHQKVIERGLVCALDFLRNFKVQWIKIVLSRIHDMKIWLEGGLIKITKEMIHQGTSYPSLIGKKKMRCQSKEIIQTNTQAVWNKRGMTISTVTDPKIDFAVRVISHKFY